MTSIPETHEAIGQFAAGAPITSFRLPTPKPGRDQVLVRVEWIAGTPVTVWMIDFQITNPSYPFVIGESIAGKVVAAGEDVNHVKVGDTILSFSFSPDDSTQRGAQEYVLLDYWKVGKVPSNITPQQAAIVPDNLLTAYFVLFDQLRLPAPEAFPAVSPPADASAPILIWGAAGSTGQYTVQLLHAAGYKKVFAVASSKHHEFLRSLGATDTFDYNSRNVTEQIVAAAGGPVKLVFDAIGDEQNSLKPVSQIVGNGSKVAFLLPVRVGGYGSVGGVKWTTDVVFPTGAELVPVAAGLYQKDEKLKNELQPKIIPELLANGSVKPNRFTEITGETVLERALKTVDILRQGQLSGERIVFQVAKD